VQQIEKVETEQRTLEQQISKSTVKEQDITTVTNLIEEKARLAEAKVQLKKNCKEEQQRLQKEKERIQKRQQEMAAAEQAAILNEIEAEYKKEDEKVLLQKKTLAEENRKITVFQRKIESVPSNIEISQFHKRLVELFDNLNTKSDDYRKYCNLQNTN